MSLNWLIAKLVRVAERVECGDGMKGGDLHLREEGRESVCAYVTGFSSIPASKLRESKCQLRSYDSKISEKIGPIASWAGFISMFKHSRGVSTSHSHIPR